MEKHELKLNIEQKATVEKGESTFGKSRLAVAAAIISAIASSQGCDKSKEMVQKPSDSGTIATSEPSNTPDASTTPVTTETNKLTYAQAEEARKKHCNSRHGMDQESGGTYPFVVIQGSKIKILDACDPSGAHEVPFYPFKNGNFTDYAIPTTTGREAQNCYIIKDTSNTSGLNAERVNYKTYTEVTRIPQFAFLNQFGTQTVVDGDKISLVKAPLEKCPPNAPIASGGTKPGTGGQQVKHLVTDPNMARLAQEAKESAERAKTEADRATEEANRSALAAINAGAYARDLEEYRKTVLRNNSVNVIVPSTNVSRDAGAR